MDVHVSDGIVKTTGSYLCVFGRGMSDMVVGFVGFVKATPEWSPKAIALAWAWVCTIIIFTPLIAAGAEGDAGSKVVSKVLVLGIVPDYCLTAEVPLDYDVHSNLE